MQCNLWLIRKKKCQLLSRVQLSAAPWAVVRQAPFTVHGILQSRILEWVAIPFSRGLPDPGIEPRTRSLQADSLPSEPPGQALRLISFGWKWRKAVKRLAHRVKHLNVCCAASQLIPGPSRVYLIWASAHSSSTELYRNFWTCIFFGEVLCLVYCRCGV